MGKPIKIDHGKGVMSRVGVVESISLDKANKRLYFKGKILDPEVYKRIQAKLITGVSVGVAAQIDDGNASDLEFEEISLVEEPACAVCKLLEKQKKGGECKMDEIEKLELDLDSEDVFLEDEEISLDMYGDIEKALKDAGLEDDVVGKVMAIVRKFVKSKYPGGVEESKEVVKNAVSDADLGAIKNAAGKIMGLIGKAKAADIKPEDLEKLKKAVGELVAAAKKMDAYPEVKQSLAVKKTDLDRLVSFVKKLAERLAKLEAENVRKSDVDKIAEDVKHAAEKVDTLKSHLKEEFEEPAGKAEDISEKVDGLEVQLKEVTEKTSKEIAELTEIVKKLDETPIVKSSVDLQDSIEGEDKKELHFGELICGSRINKQNKEVKII
jgi:methyl-accepting chemotaxis protein